MDCPACKQPLIVVERTGIEVDWCPACHGIWFDAGEIELLAEMAGRKFVMPPPDPSPDTSPDKSVDPSSRPSAGPPPAATPVRTCPRCPAKMGQRMVVCEPPVLVDICPRGHGIWLDQGELGAFISAMPESYRSEDGRALGSFLGEVFRHSHGGPAQGRDNPPGGLPPAGC